MCPFIARNSEMRNSCRNGSQVVKSLPSVQRVEYFHSHLKQTNTEAPDALNKVPHRPKMSPSRNNHFERLNTQDFVSAVSLYSLSSNGDNTFQTPCCSKLVYTQFKDTYISLKKYLAPFIRPRALSWNNICIRADH